MTNDFTKQINEAADKVKQFVPEVKFNKNGYEIRTQVLDMAKSLAEFEYSAKFQQVEMTAKRDPQTGELVQSVQFPEIPGADKVLEAAQKFYDFVNQNTSKK
jgi:hypothetical protein